MLKLKNIVKTYTMGDNLIHALKDVCLEFRKNDFVSILGPSGCGKTTMLNIIGGLDRYTSGDLVINGVSTKEYKDVDWDIYRNNSIGFVFQSYNLISHQTVYTNVELALTLAGITPAERKKRVVEVLKKVGLGDQIHKKPTQMSGGQMQRVAIARALVNNPDILLADEPTGALDSETSSQIMELLKEIAQDRLVIMVTHNPDIAKEYSTRIIKLLDGNVVDDSNPYDSGQEPVKKEKGKRKKISMSFFTALALSFKNLLTKKTRTILTSFAGSIGIIGIALILSLSSGMQSYVTNLEKDTFSTYPLEIQSQSMDMAGMMAVMMDRNVTPEGREPDKIYNNSIMTSMMQSVSNQVTKNDLKLFMQHIKDEENKAFYDNTNSIQFGYNVELQIFKPDTSVEIQQINPSPILESLGMGSSTTQQSGMSMGMTSSEIWTELLENRELLSDQYEVVAGAWPNEFNEVVLVANRRNEISDMALYSLGLLDKNELDELMKAAMKGEEYTLSSTDTSFTYDEILSTSFKLLLNTDYFVKESGIWVNKNDDSAYMKNIIQNALDIKISGIIRPKERSAVSSINGSVAYNSTLTDYIIEEIQKTDIAKEQLADPETNVLTGMPFNIDDYTANLTMDDVKAFMSEMSPEEQAQAGAMFANMSEEEIIKLFADRIKADADKDTYEDNLALLGIADFENPSYIRLYPQGFESKKEIEKLIAEYNTIQENEGKEENVINYNDFVGLMTSSFSDIINIISYVLIAFVAISLFVSSIMIAIITYISILERTKEIGILRSIGASKKDITRVFNAETVIEGFVAGLMGVLITLILNIPINIVIKHLTNISDISALPVWGGIGLIIISVLLTVIAGFIPSKMAAKKDPVAALRTE